MSDTAENIQRDPLNYKPLLRVFDHSYPYQRIGKILASHGMIYDVNLSRAQIGASVEFITETGEQCLGEVVGIKGRIAKVMPYEELAGINSETKVILKDLSSDIKISNSLLGRVVDFQGLPIDGKGPLEGPFDFRNILGETLNPLERPPIREPLDVGINSINCFMTAGKGQRLSIMAVQVLVSLFLWVWLLVIQMLI